MAGRFAPLGCCSWYSLLDGVSSPDELLRRAAVLGYPALALTDPNSLAGAVEFVGAAKGHSVRPILGATLRHQTQTAVALIAEACGYRSLCRIISRLHHGNSNFAALLAENAEGLHLLVN